MSTAVKTALAWARPRAEAIVAVALLLVSLGVFLRLALYIDRAIVDDAVISIGFARSLADGEGFRPTPYSPIVEGFSNPTWTIFLTFFEKLNVNSMGVAKWAGFVFAALSLPLVFSWGPLSQRRRPQLEDAVAPLCACTNATLAYWALGGLEIGLLVFLLALFGALISVPRTPRVGVAIGLTAAGVCLTRPEGPLYVAVFSVPFILDAALDRSIFEKPNRLAILAFVLPLVAYLIFRRLYFGAWLPNTYYAKSAWFIGLKQAKQWTMEYIQGFVERTKILLIAGGVGALLSVVGRLRVAKTALASASLVGAMFYFTWHSHSDWMREWRFLAPIMPFVGYSIGAAVSALRDLFRRGFFQKRRAVRVVGHLAVAAAAIGVLVKTTQAHASRWTEVKNEGADVPRDPKDRKTYGNDVRAMIAPFEMTHPLVATPDMGWLQVGLRDYELLDMAGLMDVAIARHFNNYDALRDYLKNEGLPTVLLYWGPSTWLAKVPDVLGNFRPGPSSTYMLYSRVTPTSDDRCPDGKPHALAIGADELALEIESDLEGDQPVRALARWRCSLSYRKDADLPSPARRNEIARAAAERGRQAERDGKNEKALRSYSLCAVIGLTSISPSVSCRMNAERLRARLFPRRKNQQH